MSAHATIRAVWRKAARLPWRARVAGLVLLSAASLPPAAAIVLGESAPADSHGTGLVDVAAAVVAAAAVLALEPPRAASPLAYARQLRARFLELQSMFDADDRRRPGEGKEKEDDRVPFDP